VTPLSSSEGGDVRRGLYPSLPFHEEPNVRMKETTVSEQEQEKADKPDKQEVDVRVFAPRDPSDIRDFTFNKHTTVGEAAAEVAPQFGYEGGQPTFAKDGTALDRDKQLVAAQVRDGDLLEIVDVGGGV
jgi:hypothetical protein